MEAHLANNMARREEHMRLLHLQLATRLTDAASKTTVLWRRYRGCFQLADWRRNKSDDTPLCRDWDDDDGNIRQITSNEAVRTVYATNRRETRTILRPRLLLLPLLVA